MEKIDKCIDGNLIQAKVIQTGETFDIPGDYVYWEVDHELTTDEVDELLKYQKDNDIQVFITVVNKVISH